MQKWTPANEPPLLDKGRMKAVVVARQSDKGKWYVFGAWYLNDYELADEMDALSDEARGFTGFFTCAHHYEYEEYYEPIEVSHWHPMPNHPE